MKRRFTNPPLEEHVFEVRWTDPNGPQALIDQYELSLGQVYSKYKNKFRRESIFKGPKGLISMIPESIIIDRFIPVDSPAGNLHFPLYQYGPGIASYNVDKNYDWTNVLAKSCEFFNILCDANEDLAENITSISLRTIDLFQTDEINNFLETGLGIQIKTPLDGISEFDLDSSIPTYQESWGIKGEPNIKVKVSAGVGVANNKNGVLLDIQVVGESFKVIDKTSIETTLARLHQISGLAFFGLITDYTKSMCGYSQND